MNFNISNPLEIIKWVYEKNQKTIVTTSFGDQSAVLLNMIHTVNPLAQIIWIDTQFNTESTLRLKEMLCNKFSLNLLIYSGPKWDTEIPDHNTPEYNFFVEQIKIIPFKKMLSELQPVYWIRGVRKEETDYRNTIKVIEESDDIIKVSPLLDWSHDDMEKYIQKYNLPNEVDYFDPTKPDKCECGLHTTKIKLGAQ